MDEFISEDDLKTFEGWLRYQAIEASTMTVEELANWRRRFEEVRQASDKTPKVGLMKLMPEADEYLYAVAVQDGADLWLNLWVKRTAKGEFFVFLPRGDRSWDVHTSYHLDGTLHMKSHGHKVLTPEKHQPLRGAFRGCVSLGCLSGFGPKSVGAICDPTAFSGIVKLEPNVLGPSHGWIAVDLVEPGQEPTEYSGRIITRQVFKDFLPWVVITVGAIDT